ncbi:MAG TPA: FtsX-like permease family protein [Burkholderiales bacterium]|nr:FtsX-like permease family protein [Burkholderiales bacterium]
MRQAWRMLARDWRAGELRVLAAALVLAVASVTSVGFFADRIGRGLARDAHQLLGADLVLISDRPFGDALTAPLAASGLQGASAVTFMSMANAAQGAQLAGVKAVSSAYPLRGRLRIAPEVGAPDAPAPAGPPPRGTVWIEERLVQALGTPVGAKLRLGRSEFTVSAVLTLEPERGANFFNLAPRLMMNEADVAATGLIQTGSRVWYYLYAAGTRDQVAAYEQQARSRLERGQRVETLESGRPEIRASIDRAQRFLGLTALLAAVLAGVAIALGTRRFVERHLDGCAVMRCLGATQARLTSLFGLEFLILGIGACAVGALAGFAAQHLIGLTLEDILKAQLPPPGLLPALQGFLVGLVLLLGFALPPLLQLKNVPAVAVIRREAGRPKARTLVAYAAGFIALGLLLAWQAGDPKLGTYVVGGFAGAVLAFMAVAWALLRVLTGPGLTRRMKASSLRYGLVQLRRHLAGNAIQTASLALGLTAVLLLTFTRNDLVEAWRRSAPPDAPNRFLMGVQRDQIPELEAFFRQRQLAAPELFPMVRGRVTARNGQPVSERDYEEERARRLIEREFNLSFMEAPPGHNTVSAGRWFAPDAKEISVEEGVARALGWTLGDELEFAVAGETFKARITSLRKLRWDSMRVNFFVIAPTSLLAPYPASFISAFRIEPAQEPALHELVKRFPNITIVDVGAAVRQAQGVIDQLIDAVQFIFLFALGAGLLVLYSALVATEDERRREAAVMRVFGASRAQVAGSQRAEFLAMGAIAGLLATLGAAAIGQLIARRVFELDLPPSAELWIAGPLAGIALLSINAWLSARKVLRASPALTLRDSV